MLLIGCEDRERLASLDKSSLLITILSRKQLAHVRKGRILGSLHLLQGLSSSCCSADRGDSAIKVIVDGSRMGSFINYFPFRMFIVLSVLGLQEYIIAVVGIAMF